MPFQISLSPKTKSMASTLFTHFIMLSTGINHLCVSIVLFYLGIQYPEIKPYAYIAGLYILVAKAYILVVAFVVSAWWHIFKLIAPDSAGENLEEWADLQKARTAAGKSPSRWIRVFRGLIGLASIYNGITLGRTALSRNGILLPTFLGAACFMAVVGGFQFIYAAVRRYPQEISLPEDGGAEEATLDGLEKGVKPESNHNLGMEKEGKEEGELLV
ncbi:hypothetical protein BV22DRAFT_1031719 [Leucogyrophana mollusca]|uniref:Uncharacterized protein n=1 Tax=Leucogyrophana mollusca TaxID=85980 RepID=A0ACB8BQV3_9AGAM|nr:hypothetical protein BV22DRAFT_1031719 [Leucogyrophana mollusca]